MRVPTPNVSVVDLTVFTEKPATVQSVNAGFEGCGGRADEGDFAIRGRGIGFVDFRGNPHSSIVDSGYTRVVGTNCVQVLSWYDNEWGYSSRCRDLIKFLAK